MCVKNIHVLIIKHSCTNHNHVHVEIISCVISKIVSDRPYKECGCRSSLKPRTENLASTTIASATNTTMALNYLHLAHRQLKNPADRDFAVYLDSQYPTFRHEFHIPTNEGVGA